MSSGSFNAIAMVNASFAGFVVDIKVLQIIIEIDGSCAEVSSEESGVGGEYRRDINSTFSAKGKCNSSKPFMEMSNDGFRSLVRDKLLLANVIKESYLSQEPGYEISENDSFVCFVIAGRCGYPSDGP